MSGDIERFARDFRFFAGMCEGYSPLYAALSPRVADDQWLLALALERQPRQPPVNLVFGAVHDLLLAGVEHPLRAFYPSVGGTAAPDDAYTAFADFCHAYEPEIRALVATRRVQTNEVGRCGLLLPAFALAWERWGRRPLHLVELGASAGLNLRFDRYHYEYGGGHSYGPDSPVRLRVELRPGVDCPLPETMPSVAERLGLDIAPIDVTDDDAIRWVEALIWPDMMQRIEQFRAAVSIARADPPPLVAGDGLDLLPEIVESARSDVLPCVYHSHATYQMTSEWQERFGAMLDDLGRRRDLAHVSLEWLRDQPGPQLHLTIWRSGERCEEHLADCHHHGVWMRWLA